MADDNLPWMKFYPSDFMGSRAVRSMTGIQRGIYISLWIRPGDRFTMLAFGRAEERGQKLIQRAAHEWQKNGAEPADLEATA